MQSIRQIKAMSSSQQSKSELTPVLSSSSDQDFDSDRNAQDIAVESNGNVIHPSATVHGIPIRVRPASTAPTAYTLSFLGL